MDGTCDQNAEWYLDEEINYKISFLNTNSFSSYPLIAIIQTVIERMLEIFINVSRYTIFRCAHESTNTERVRNERIYITIYLLLILIRFDNCSRDSEFSNPVFQNKLKNISCHMKNFFLYIIFQLSNVNFHQLNVIIQLWLCLMY